MIAETRQTITAQSEEETRRAVLVTHVLPEPPWTGERRRVAATRDYLSTHFACDVALCARSDSVCKRLLRKLANPLAPPYAARFLPPREDLASYDVIWVFELWALANVPKRHWKRVIWDKDTVMADSYADATGRVSRLMRHWIGWFESRAARRVAHTFVSLQSPRLAKDEPTLLPNGYETPDGAWRPDPSPHTPLRLGFVGLLAHEPNRLGLTWFASEVLPRLRANIGEVELWVAGKGLPKDDEAMLRRTPGVRLCGYVPDLAGFYRDVDVILAPLLTGAGTPTKVVEALGHGLPVIGTAKGLRGLNPDLTRWCVQVAADDWTRAVLDARGMLAAGAVPTAEIHERFSWPAVFERSASPILGIDRG